MSIKKSLNEIYDRLSRHYGPTDWWPGDTPFEIAVGAILTQNAAWTNVERAIDNLKAADLLSPSRMLDCDTPALEQAIRPSGYFRVKTKRVRAFCRHLVDNYGGCMKCLALRPLPELRAELLGVDGIGPETADDILLYACGKTVFVVDAYTRRILSRHGLCPEAIKYEDLRALFEGHLEPDRHMFAEYHGLIVYTGKDFCRRNPKCEQCPLRALLKNGVPRMAPAPAR